MVAGDGRAAVVVVTVVIVLIVILVFAGLQCQCGKHLTSHIASSVTGLHRRITLYAYDGSVIKEWEGQYNVQVEGSSARFLEDGRAITISGTFIIEEDPKPKKKEAKDEKQSNRNRQ